MFSYPPFFCGYDWCIQLFLWTEGQCLRRHFCLLMPCYETDFLICLPNVAHIKSNETVSNWFEVKYDESDVSESQQMLDTVVFPLM